MFPSFCPKPECLLKRRTWSLIGQGNYNDIPKDTPTHCSPRVVCVAGSVIFLYVRFLYVPVLYVSVFIHSFFIMTFFIHSLSIPYFFICSFFIHSFLYGYFFFIQNLLLQPSSKKIIFIHKIWPIT